MAEQQPRDAERYAHSELGCELGSVVDMSASGVRLQMKQRPPVDVGQVLLLDLTFGQGKLAIKGQVRWWRRVGLRRYEIGLKFVRVKPGAEAMLESLARDGYAPMSSRNQARQSHRKTGKVTAETTLPNYFRVLGLRPDADADTIHRRYRKLAAALHPDVNKDPDASERFQRLREAYRVLSDARRREAYTSLIA